MEKYFFSTTWCSVPKNFSYSLENYYLYNQGNYQHLTQEIWGYLIIKQEHRHPQYFPSITILHLFLALNPHILHCITLYSADIKHLVMFKIMMCPLRCNYKGTTQRLIASSTSIDHFNMWFEQRTYKKLKLHCVTIELSTHVFRMTSTTNFRQAICCLL